MSTASVLDDIDYDSSFEMVEEEKFEKIENTDNSENFQYVSTKGNTVKEVNINSNEKKKKEVRSSFNCWGIDSLFHFADVKFSIFRLQFKSSLP